MRKIKLLISLFFIFFMSHSIKAQNELSYKKIDSLSLKYFNEGNYTALEELGDKVIEAGKDYFYLNLRLGVAKFKLGKYYEADKIYRKAKKSNPNNQWVKENMFWNYIWMEDYWMADGMYDDFSEEEKSMLLYNTKDLLAFGYAEIGTKISNLNDSVGALNYASLGGYHKFSPSFAAYHQLSFLTQETFDGNYNQFEYYLAPNYRLNRSIRLVSRLNFAYNKFDFDFRSTEIDNEITITPLEDRRIETREDGEYSGNIITQTFYGEVGVNYTYNRWDLTPSFGVFIDKINNNYQIDKNITTTTTVQPLVTPPLSPAMITRTLSNALTINDSSTNETQLQLSTGISYVLPLLKDKIKVGANVYFIDGNNSEFVISPNVNYKASEKLDLAFNYLKIGEYYFAEKTNTVLHNIQGIERQKISLTGSYKLKTNLTLYLTYQNEAISDNLRSVEYNTNNIFLGLKF